MPTQSRQVSRSTPTTSGTSSPTTGATGGAAGRSSRQQGALGNAAVASRIGASGPATSTGTASATGTAASPGAGTAVQDRLPRELAFEDAGLSFSLPGDVALTGGWNQLQTTAPTGVWLNVSRTQLRVSFSPALEVDAQWPLSNVAWRGFTYDFAQGRLVHVDVENTQIGIPVAGSVEDGVRGFVAKLVAGTPLTRRGYDPAADADLGATIRKLQTNFQGQRGSAEPGELRPQQVTNVGLSATVRTTTPIEAMSGRAGLSIPAGATLTLGASLEGDGATVASAASRGAVPGVRGLDLSSSDLLLQRDGEPIARIRALRVGRGGVVDVTDFEPLGSLAEVGAGESLIRLLGLAIALRTGDGSFAGDGDLSPRGVNGFAEREMEKGLTNAVQTLVRQNHDAIPGLDLRTLLGVEPKAPSGPQS